MKKKADTPKKTIDYMLPLLSLLLALVIVAVWVGVRQNRLARTYDDLMNRLDQPGRSLQQMSAPGGKAGVGAGTTNGPAAAVATGTAGQGTTPEPGQNGSGTGPTDSGKPARREGNLSLEPLYYNLSDAKQDNPDLLRRLLDANSLLLLGSSELSTIGEGTHPIQFYQDGAHDFELLLQGRGYTQSLMHAVNVAALSDRMENKKVALILSPQWFTKDHLDPRAFASVFRFNMYGAMLQNPDLSPAVKQKLVARCHELLDELPDMKGHLSEVEQPVQETGSKLKGQLEENRRKEEILEILQEARATVEERRQRAAQDPSQRPFDRKATSISLDERMQMAELGGTAAVDDKQFYVERNYYKTYMDGQYERYKDSATELSYLDSPEYGDLDLFLEVCRDLGVKPLLISVPVNGRWNDYIGLSKDERAAYYEKIRQFAADRGVDLLDLSDHEYEPYFFRDIMHLGWKGWVYIEDRLEKFVREN